MRIATSGRRPRRSARRSLRSPGFVARSRTTRCRPAVSATVRVRKRRARSVAVAASSAVSAIRSRPRRSRFAARAATRPGLTRSTAGPPPPVGGGTAAGGKGSTHGPSAPSWSRATVLLPSATCTCPQPSSPSERGVDAERELRPRDRVRAERGREQRVLAQVAEHVAAEQRRQPGIAHHEAADHRRVAVAVAEDEHGRREAGGRAAARAEGDVALAGGPAEVAARSGAGRHAVDLLLRALADVADQHVAGDAVEREAPRVAQAEGPHGGRRAGRARVEAQDLAQPAAGVLRVRAARAVAHARVEQPVGAEGELAAVVVGRPGA